MTELERRAALAGIIAAGPNASYDSAIDSLPDECYCDLANSPSVSLRRSSLFGVCSQAMATGYTALSASPLMACSTTATAPSSSSSYQCKFSPRTSKSASLNGPIMFNPSQQSATNGALSVYRSLADYHRLNGNSTTTRFSAEQLNTSKSSGPGLSLASIRVRQGASTGSKVLDSRTSMAMFLDQIDASSSSLLHGKGQASQQRLTDSCARRQSTSPANGNSSARGATVGASTWSSQWRGEQQAAFSSASSGDMMMLEEGKQHGAAHVLGRSGECLRQRSQQRVCSVPSPTGHTAALSASSLLRSSSSFSTSYRQRPNVTLIRRKSASERLAESRSKYIRSDPDEAEYSPGTANTLALATNDGGQSLGDDELADVHLVTGCPMRQLRATPTSTKSSHTSSSRLSPISDNVCNHAQEESCPAASGAVHSHVNLVDRIHCQLNKSKQYSMSSCPKKRVSPRNSDGSSLSNGMTKLEMKLRELITIDTGHELLSEPTLQLNAPSHRPPSVQVEVPVSQHPETLQQEREARNIYRAEPKFIGSSTSSLSSMYSEPNNLSLSDKGSVAPSAEPKATCQPTANFPVVRSKSDASPKKQVIEKYRGSHIERLFGSLGLDSQYYQPENEQLSTRKVALCPSKGDKTWESSNLNGYSIVESPLHESLFKRCGQEAVDGAPLRKGLSKATSLSTPKSGSTNELSSLESSQLSVSEHICKDARNHSKSTSKLTMENLLMHQQNLASSRSCHNLVISQQSGPSVVERNAKIIKWLVHVNKAMGQTPSWHA